MGVRVNERGRSGPTLWGGGRERWDLVGRTPSGGGFVVGDLVGARKRERLVNPSEAVLKRYGSVVR